MEKNQSIEAMSAKSFDLFSESRTYKNKLETVQKEFEMIKRQNENIA